MVRLADLAAPPRLRRLAVVLAAFVGLALGAMTIRATIAVETARSEVEDCLTAFVGHPLHLTGKAAVALLPWPNVRFQDVALVDEHGVVARMEEMRVSLDVAALLLGRVRPEKMRMMRPEIRLDLEPPSLAATDIAARLAQWKPSTVVIVEGRIVLASRSGDERLDGVTLTLSWPRPTANIELHGSLSWRGEPVTVDLEAPSPATLLAGASGASSISLSAAPVRIAASGTGSLLGASRFEGRAEIDATDAARLARWVGRPSTPDLLAGRLRLDGRLAAEADGATLGNARVDLAGNRGEGALTLHWAAARPRLGGTVAFAGIDLAGDRPRPFGHGLAALPLDGGAVGFDYDLRLSTPTLALPGFSLTRVAAALHVADGRLHAEIGNAEYLGRPVSLVVRGALEEAGLSAQVRAFGEGLPLAELAQIADVPGIESGRASVALEGDTRCRDLGGCFAGLNARLAVDARTVTVTGASPFADISRFRPIVPQANGTRVTTTWDRVGVDLRLAAPRVEVGRVEILGQGARFLFGGSGDLVTGALDLTGHAYFPAFRPDPARNGTTEVAVPMRIGGTIRRLEATARDMPTTNGTDGTNGVNGTAGPTVSP